MNVLSLFDGISCGMIALERAGIKVDRYYASEIKDFAIKCSKEHYPNIIQIGDVTKVSYSDGILHTEVGDFLTDIDLVIGGSPCQDFSVAGSFAHKTERGIYGLEGDKSRLFYEYLRIKDEIKPKYFLLENVKMKKNSKGLLDLYMGVVGLEINSKLVSYQSRGRFYWTNIPNVTVPADRNISFQDFKDTDADRIAEATPNMTPSRIKMWNGGNGKSGLGTCVNITYSDKVGCLTRKQDRAPNAGMIQNGDWARYLTRRELELAQTLPVGYCDCLTYNQVQDVTGDGWTVDVIAHIFKNLKEEEKWQK